MNETTKTNNNMPTEEKIIEILQTVYDPEFPIIDVYTLWLIYNIEIKNNKIKILMTLTSPACPLWDVITENVVESIKDQYPKMKVSTEITFEPMWSPDSIKDDDLKRLFDI